MSHTNRDTVPIRHEPKVINHGAKHAPFYTPEQFPPGGSPRAAQPPHSLFSPLQVRTLTLHNRIAVSPMCQYSAARDGRLTAWHAQHLGGLAARGPGLVLTEVLAVSPEGRITPGDAGIWDDAHVGPLREAVGFAHSQGARIGAQVGHAGRMASTKAPWLGHNVVAREEAGGWPHACVAPSAIQHAKDTAMPRSMTKEDIDKVKGDFVAGVKRALRAGFDIIELHAAHGYLLQQFLSPASNHRTDDYGGSLENRARLLFEVVGAVRRALPEAYPLMVRLSAADYPEGEPRRPVDEAVELAGMLAARGVDWIDVSGSGVSGKQQRASDELGAQAPFPAAVKRAVAGTATVVSSVGGIASGRQAQGYLDGGLADAVMAARGFVKDPNLVLTWAEELGISTHMASQYGWPFGITKTHEH